MKFDEVSKTYSKRKENRNSVAADIIDNADVVESAITVSIDTVDDYADKDGTQPFTIDEAKVESLAKSIAEQGQLEPLIVRESKDEVGRYQLLAGHHRKQALLKNGSSTCLVRVIDVNDMQAYCIVCETNIHHEKPKPSELCKIFLRYRKMAKENDEKLTADKLAAMFGISKEQMYRLIAMDKLTRAMKKLVDEGYVSTNSIKDIAAIDNWSQNVIADYIEFVGKKFSVSKVKKLIEYLKINPKATRDDFESCLTVENKMTCYYDAIKLMNVDMLSSFLFAHMSEFSSEQDIKDFLSADRTENDNEDSE